MKVAFIVQRYGAEILGGSEYHCRLMAEHLSAAHTVEVLTTCAREYTTWENAYPEGKDRVRGVTVRRFANAETRGPRGVQYLLRLDFLQPAQRGRRAELAQTTGALVPGAH